MSLGARRLGLVWLVGMLVTTGGTASTLTDWREALARADAARLLTLWRDGRGQLAFDEDGATLLHRAMQVYSSERPAVVEALIDAGAPANWALHDGQTPLHWATRFECDACVPLLLAAGADVQARDEDGNTALFSANAVSAPLLIAAGADPLARNVAGEVPLHRNRQAAFLAAGVDVRNPDGLTPLHFAALAGNLAAIDWLLARGADPAAVTSKDSHYRAVAMSKAFGPGVPVPAGSRPYDLARDLHRRSRWTTQAYEPAMLRLEAVTPRRHWWSR